LNEVFSGELANLDISAAEISVKEATIDLEKAVLEGTATDEDIQMLEQLRSINTEITKQNAGGQFDKNALGQFKEIMPWLEENYTKPRQTAAVDEYNDSGTTLEQTNGGVVQQGFRIMAGMIKHINPFDGGKNTPSSAPSDDQQSALIPSLLESNNSKLDIMNDQLTKLTSATGAAGLMTARAIDKNATFQGIEERIT